jgi:hypothetical protein
VREVRESEGGGIIEGETCYKSIKGSSKLSG